MSYELAEKFLNQADELIESRQQSEQLLEALDQAEKWGADDVSVLCRSARLLFRHGLLHGKGRFFLLALDKLKLVEEKNSLFLDTRYVWWQLWGNILIQVGKLLNDVSFFESALQKYQRAATVLERLTGQIDPELYWDWGDAWVLLGQKSGESSDLQQALAKFHQAHSGATSIFFRLDYGNAYLHYGHLTGNPHTVEEGIALFRGVIADSYNPEHPPSIVYNAAWRKLTLALKIRFQLSHTLSHFEEADRIFREAILACAKNSDLWLDWGDLYLLGGWIRRDLKLIETGLEKLTSSKIKECDPVRVSALLGFGLILLGLFLENLKLIKEGKGRIEGALEVDTGSRALSFASGFATLALALYFSDSSLFSNAVTLFEKGIQEDARSVEYWHALFQTLMAWGVQSDDVGCLQKGISAISRLCTLRPYSAIHLNEWGVALMRLKQYEEDRERQLVYLEEAIDKFRQAAELGEEEETLYNWGCALDLLGEVTGNEEEYCHAIELLSRALEKKPNFIHIRYHLGLAYSHLGELTLNPEYLQHAIDLFEAVAKLDPEDENIWNDLGYAQLNLAEAILSSFNPEGGARYRTEAEKSFIRATELGCADAYYHLACLYSLSGFYDASMRSLIKAGSAGVLPPATDLEHDEWLIGVRNTLAFQEFMATLGQIGESHD